MTPEDKKRIETIRTLQARQATGEWGVINFLLTQLDEAHEALRSIRDNYDCDSDAHKYNTECRCCLAFEVLGEKQ